MCEKLMSSHVSCRFHGKPWFRITLPEEPFGPIIFGLEKKFYKKISGNNAKS
jgi:hypothetical protein